MNPLESAAMGGSSIVLSRLGVGTGPLGNLYAPVTDSDAKQVVEHAVNLGIRYFDTAPIYGYGLAETRLGRGLSGSARERCVVSTKVGRLLRENAPPDEEMFYLGEPFFKETPPVNPVWDFTYDGVMASLTESLRRLSMASVDIVFVHEPPERLIETAIADGYRALADLRQAGVVGAIGVGWDRPDLMAHFVAETDCDCVLLAGRYTLLDQSALVSLLPACVEHETTVIIGGVYNSGVVADPSPGATFDYVPASADVLARVQAIQGVCREFGVPIKAAALQFSFGHPAVAAVLVGVRSVVELDENFALFAADVPDELWSELTKRNLAPRALSDAEQQRHRPTSET
jgi:D-threo-aldose 1-dehydrogenase